MVKLVATDLDGTLLGDDKVIPKEIFSLTARLRERGIRFVAASGRSPYTLKANFAPIAGEIDYICDNGAVAIADGKIVRNMPVPKPIVRRVAEWAESEDVHILLCGTKTTYMLPVEGTKFERHVCPYYFNCVSEKDLTDIGDDVNKIAICDLRGPKTGSAERLQKMLGDDADVVVSGDVWMDVMAKGVSKGEALAAIQEYRGVTKAETVAFGDYYNDVSMLACAEYAYVMKNANEDMFRFGNRIADGNNEGGVLKVLRTLADGTFR
ncbi:MAG: HAD family hydrolase [Clostridiales bacterium]|nr:HAD family hydrolase [Clostridiales bacterium]